IQQDKAMALGIPSAAIDQTLRVELSGYTVGTYSDPNMDNNDYAIVVTVPRGKEANIKTLDGIMVDNV
ncbi:hypothetical protein ACFRAE_17845, partial [Sphingobacterium sp. HJSM2_6]|uniref:hypothetical protein n=1 Tax=Sphingobacterium sp. HJSM2_6 TaxID=3366264 RepID=UPI003BE4EEAD